MTQRILANYPAFGKCQYHHLIDDDSLPIGCSLGTQCFDTPLQSLYKSMWLGAEDGSKSQHSGPLL